MIKFTHVTHASISYRKQNLTNNYRSKMEVYRNDVGFDNFESKFFSFESILESDYNDPDINFFNDKLQEIDSPYFSVENFKTVSDQLNGDKFSILHLNIRSLNKNIDNLRDFLASLKGKFSVIVLTESWCDETANKNSLFDLENYNSVHKTRKNKKGGGICIYIHKSIHFKIRNDVDLFNDEIETASVEIVKSNLKNFIITGIYRPPKGNIKFFKDYCKELLSKKKTSGKNVFIVGDLNINSLDYESNEPVKNFFNLVFQNGFLPLIQRATRVTKTTATAIDHIITDAIFKNKMTSGIIKTDITDHFPLFTILEKYNKNSPEKTKIMKRDFTEENIHTFEFLFKNIDWNRFLPLDSPNLAYGNLLKIFSDL